MQEKLEQKIRELCELAPNEEICRIEKFRLGKEQMYYVYTYMPPECKTCDADNYYYVCGGGYRFKFKFYGKLWKPHSDYIVTHQYKLIFYCALSGALSIPSEWFDYFVKETEGSTYSYSGCFGFPAEPRRDDEVDLVEKIIFGVLEPPVGPYVTDAMEKIDEIFRKHYSRLCEYDDESYCPLEVALAELKMDGTTIEVDDFHRVLLEFYLKILMEVININLSNELKEKLIQKVWEEQDCLSELNLELILATFKPSILESELKKRLKTEVRVEDADNYFIININNKNYIINKETLIEHISDYLKRRACLYGIEDDDAWIPELELTDFILTDNHINSYWEFIGKTIRELAGL